jgi:hypothetical protein
MKQKLALIVFYICFLLTSMSGQVSLGKDVVICNGGSYQITATNLPPGNNCYSWKPAAGLSCDNCPNPVAKPLATTTYTMTLYGEDFSFKQSDDIKVQVIDNAIFKKFDDQKYGFDDFFDEGLPNWKSIEFGMNDQVLVQLPENTYSFYKFVPEPGIGFNVSPIFPQSDNFNLNISANIYGIGDIVSTIRNTNETVCNKKIKIESFAMKYETVAIRVVNESGQNSVGNINPSYLEKYLNNIIYNQAVVSWKVTGLSDATVHYDLNNDGKLEAVLNGLSYSDEEKEIINLCNAQGYDHIVFLVNNPSFPLRGQNPIGDRYAFIFMDFATAEPENTIAHELGHALNLQHKSFDYNNLMYDEYHPGRVILRKNQWEDIHN